MYILIYIYIFIIICVTTCTGICIQHIPIINLSKLVHTLVRLSQLTTRNPRMLCSFCKHWCVLPPKSSSTNSISTIMRLGVNPISVPFKISTWCLVLVEGLYFSEVGRRTRAVPVAVTLVASCRLISKFFGRQGCSHLLQTFMFSKSVKLQRIT